MADSQEPATDEDSLRKETTLNPIETKLSRARTAMLLDAPWFGMLSMRLQFEAADPAKVPTMATDGTRLFYNPAFVASLPGTHLKGVIAHEVMHCAMLHPYRRAGRDPHDWNAAGDYVINAELKRAGFDLPSDVLYERSFEGMSADTVYARIHGKQPGPNGQQQQQQQQPSQGQQQQGAGGNEPPPLSTGECMDAPPDQPGQGDGNGQGDGEADGNGQGKGGQGAGSGKNNSAEDWQIAGEQATRAAKGAGSDPGSAARAAKAAANPRDDWKAILHEFITQAAQPSDYSWLTPNRRHIHNGLYLPGVRKESLGRIVVAVDTSGSISPKDLADFAAELQAISSDTQPEVIEVLYCDTAIQARQEFTADDEVKLEAAGGGGTLYRPVFADIEQRDEQPVCLIYATDLEPYDDYPNEPAYPVLWLTQEWVTDHAPFGRTVRMAA